MKDGTPLPPPEHNKKPPHNLEVEQALLGAIFVNNDCLTKVRPWLKGEHFFEPLHGRIFDTCVTLWDADRPATPVTLKPAFESDPSITELDQGVRYLITLASSAATTLHAEDHGRHIHELALRRAMILAAERLAHEASALSESTSPAAVLGAARADLDRIDEALDTSSRAFAQASTEDCMDALEQLLQDIGNGEQQGVQFSLRAMDYHFGAMAPGDLTIMAGRPSMGKTALALECARRVAMGGGRWDTAPEDRRDGVLIISMEMSKNQLSARLVSSSTYNEQAPDYATAYRDFFDGRMSDAQRESWSAATKALRELPLRIVDRTMSVSDIRAEAGKAKRAFERDGKTLSLIVIDYLQLILPDNPSVQRVHQVGQISRGLKSLALRLSVPILCLSQLSRQVEQRDDKRPVMSDLRDSGEIEQDADNILMLYRPEYYTQKIKPKSHQEEADLQERLADERMRLTVFIEKRRNGPTGYAELFADLRYNHIRDWR